MRILTSIMMLSLFTTGAAFANGHGKDKGACKAEFASCKGKKDFHECVKAAATANNNTACTDEMAKMHDHHHHDKKDAATATPEAGK